MSSPSAQAILLGVVFVAGAAWAQPVVITEWPVPWPNTRPRDPFVETADRVWFVGQTGDYVGLFDPGDASFERYELDDGAGPHNLIVDQRGQVWYAGNRASHIGRLDPESGKIVKYRMPDPGAGDPHTLVFDPSGDIWFSVQHGNFIGHLAVQSGEVRLARVPTSKARPYGIVVSSEGRPWFTEFGTNKLGTVDPESFEVSEVELPRPEARPRRLELTSDGKVWYVDYAGGRLGRYDPGTTEITEWPCPGGPDARPYGMAVDARDRLWFVETGLRPNRLVGFDPETERFVGVTEIESGAGSVRHMMFYRPHRAIWFGTDANTIGQARLVD